MNRDSDIDREGIDFGPPEMHDLSLGRPIFFRLKAPHAKSVVIVGDFNDWDPRANTLRRRHDGVWWGTIRLRPGAYQYKFVVDGSQWCEDPLCPDKVSNNFGSMNSVCEVLGGDL